MFTIKAPQQKTAVAQQRHMQPKPKGFDQVFLPLFLLSLDAEPNNLCSLHYCSSHLLGLAAFPLYPFVNQRGFFSVLLFVMSS